jgi:hypothetical protein
MSSAPPGILKLNAYRARTLGRQYNLGIVGDANHKAGYHLGPDRTPPGDYSEKLARDRGGASHYPYYAAADDSGMDWPRSREWLANLVLDCRAGKDHTRDIREIIGSLDGRNALYWDSQAGFRAVDYKGSGHVTHTHISFFRDSADRDQSQVLRQFLEPPQQEDDMPYGIPIPIEPVIGKRTVQPIGPVLSGAVGWGPAWVSFGCDGGDALVRAVYQRDDETWWFPLFGGDWDKDTTRWVRSGEPRSAHSYGLSQGTGKLSFEIVDVIASDIDKFSIGAFVEYGPR